MNYTINQLGDTITITQPGLYVIMIIFSLIALGGLIGGAYYVYLHRDSSSLMSLILGYCAVVVFCLGIMWFTYPPNKYDTNHTISINTRTQHIVISQNNQEYRDSLKNYSHLFRHERQRKNRETTSATYDFYLGRKDGLIVHLGSYNEVTHEKELKTLTSMSDHLNHDFFDREFATSDMDAQMLFLLQDSNLIPSYNYSVHPRTYLRHHDITLRGSTLEVRRPHTLSRTLVFIFCGLVLCLLLFFASQRQAGSMTKTQFLITAVVASSVWIGFGWYIINHNNATVVVRIDDKQLSIGIQKPNNQRLRQKTGTTQEIKHLFSFNSFDNNKDPILLTISFTGSDIRTLIQELYQAHTHNHIFHIPASSVSSIDTIYLHDLILNHLNNINLQK